MASKDRETSEQDVALLVAGLVGFVDRGVAEELGRRLSQMSAQAVREVIKRVGSKHGDGFLGKPQFYVDVLAELRAGVRH